MRIDTPLRPNPEKRRSPPCQSMPASTGHSFEAPRTIAPCQTVARMPLVPQNSLSSPEAVLILVRITVREALILPDSADHCEEFTLECAAVIDASFQAQRRYEASATRRFCPYCFEVVQALLAPN